MASNTKKYTAIVCFFGLAGIICILLATAAPRSLLRGAGAVSRRGFTSYTMFLAEYSTVIECFPPEYVHPCMLGVCRRLNHLYFQIVFDTFNRYFHGNDVMIDYAHLELVLRSLETDGDRPD
jgi:hypothetical protein